MLIRAYSDLHGMLPRIDPCDVLLIAGDVCPIIGEHGVEEQASWVRDTFSEWLAQIPAERIVMTPGNHDFVFETEPVWPDLPAELLIDEAVELGSEGPTVHCSPWVPALPNWAFHANDAKLAEAAEAIPTDADIWLQHGPPYGLLDALWRNGEHVGNRHTLAALDEKPPQVFICGHIHEAAGFAERAGAMIANVSFVNEFYEPQFRHLALEWTAGKLIRRADREAGPKRLWETEHQ
ncbi:MAG: metallophosphoesterase family protein [Solirubrobacterales bacterium]